MIHAAIKATTQWTRSNTNLGIVLLLAPLARAAGCELKCITFHDLVVATAKREGAGLLSSLADTDGLAELGEDVTQVSPGDTIGFLSYANLVN